MKIIKWLSVADRFTKTYLDNQFAPLGINSSQHMYLLKICRDPGILQDSLMESFYVHPSNIVRMISTLEKNGFLTKSAYEKDKRTCRLYPTQKALDIQAQIEEICARAENLLMEGITGKDRQVFEDVLRQAGKQMARELNTERREDEFDR